MVFDKNKKRIEEHTRKDAKKYHARIQLLKARGPEWWIQYYDDKRKDRSERCPDKYQSVLGAKTYEAIRRAEIAKGEHNNKDIRHVRISEIVDAYLSEKMAGKSGEGSSRTLCNHIKRHIGHWWLDQIDRNPALIVNHFKDFPEQSWSPKYIWNYFITFRAAINHWIRFRRLTMQNPCAVVQINPDVRVLEYVPTKEDFERIIAQSHIAGLPNWIRNLLTVVFETGLRINEVMKLTVTDVYLNPEEGLPYIFVWISKQKRCIRQAIPITKEARDAFRAQLSGKTEGAIWPVKNAPYHLLSIKQLDGSFKTLSELAGVEFRPFHDYRKTAKNKFKLAGGPEVSKGMQGHATNAMDDYYTHYQRSDLEVAVANSYRTDQNTDQDERKEV